MVVTSAYRLANEVRVGAELVPGRRILFRYESLVRVDTPCGTRADLQRIGAKHAAVFSASRKVRRVVADAAPAAATISFT